MGDVRQPVHAFLAADGEIAQPSIASRRDRARHRIAELSSVNLEHPTSWIRSE